MRNLREYKSEELLWNLDFKPRRLWPSFLPVLILAGNRVIAGFDRQGQSQIKCLELEVPLDDVVDSLYPVEGRGNLENLRIRNALSQPYPHTDFLEWPVSLQHFFDDRGMSLKALRPLLHLLPWRTELSAQLIKMQGTASQLRDLLDLLCDLKFSGIQYPAVVPEQNEMGAWLEQLRRLRNPMTTQTDSKAKDTVTGVSWPRGVSAKWERQGDQAGVVIQTKVTNGLEWKKLKENLLKIEIDESLWKP